MHKRLSHRLYLPVDGAGALRERGLSAGGAIPDA